jgi:hypothetical protein
MKKSQKQKRRSILLYILGGLAWLSIIFAVSWQANAAQNFIQGYQTSTSLDQGIIVQLEPKNTSTVEPVTQSDDVNAFGVVVNSADASVAFSSSSNSSQAYVASSGHYNVLVSNQNGAINAGNYITVSSLDGVGMKDNTIQPIIVGQALNSFDGTTNVVGTTNLKSASGGSQTVSLGLVEVNIDFRRNPLQQTVTGDVPAFLAKASSTVTGGRIVTAWRIYLGLAIILGVTIVSGVILYGGVKNGLIAIGRNPLSKQPIIKGLTEVVLVALIIFITGVFGVYLLLKL